MCIEHIVVYSPAVECLQTDQPDSSLAHLQTMSIAQCVCFSLVGMGWYNHVGLSMYVDIVENLILQWHFLVPGVQCCMI